MDTERIETLRRLILSWVDSENLRKFPWRETEDAYEILVSEVLLQQTPADRVEPVYTDFLRTYPRVEDLAEADVDEVIDLIRDLGLQNIRGKALVNNAKALKKEGIPRDVEKLAELSYVSDYGANAVLCFAFGEDRPIVDSNVIRVYSRYFGRSLDVEDEKTWEFAEQVLPEERVQEFNLAVIDFAAEICQPSPKCEVCFLSDACSYYQQSGDS